MSQKRAVLLIEADEDTIIKIRTLLNQKGGLGSKTRNMIWREGISPRFNGYTSYEKLSDILDMVMEQARAVLLGKGKP